MSDVSPEREEAERAPPPVVERTISPIAGRLGARQGKVLGFAALAVGCGIFLLATLGKDKPKDETAREQPARQVVPFEPVKASTTPTLAAPGAGAPSLTGADGPQVPAVEPGAEDKKTVDLAAQRRAELAAVRGAPILAFNRGGGLTAIADVVGPGVPTVAAQAEKLTELDELRRGSTIGRAKATRLGDRNFLILAGTPIPCILQTAMDSTTPGYVSCLISRDVFSDNGAVVLMEKGTKVLGEYRAGIRQGQRRLFVLWTRAVTPAGVAISLGSPAADPVGRAGLDGQLDTHFWDRFGGALLLSIVDDGAYAIAGNTNQYGNTTRVPSDAAGIALQDSINLPPTLKKAQGSEVSIFVAQDFDFSDVYALKVR